MDVAASRSAGDAAAGTWLTVGSSVQLPRTPGPPNLASLLFQPRRGERAEDPIVLGTLDDGMAELTLKRVRRAALHVIARLFERGFRIGDTIALIRLPRTSEAVLAVAYAGMSAAGFRVLLPMYLELEELSSWLRLTGARAVVCGARELEARSTSEADQAELLRLRRALEDLHLPLLCLTDDFELPALLAGADPGEPDGADALLREIVSSTDRETECLILSTSGSSGRSKLVRYRQGAVLRCCEAWEVAGLFRPDQLGGRGLCLLFAHSMGIRAFWNAVWTRRAICLIPPEWFIEHPERTKAFLARMRPEHVTGGPAVFRTLLEFARVFPEVKSTCLRGLRHLVSCGAAFDPETEQRLRTALGAGLENAFGMTETMQVLCTLVAGPFRNGMGNPLPGVQLGLEPVESDAAELYRLHVRTPFGYAGYLGGTGDGADPAPDGWFATGDLVRLADHGLEYAGREREDWFKDAFGVKVSRRLLATRYGELGEPVLHTEFFPIADEPGLAAVVFVEAGASADGPVSTEPALLERVKALLASRNDRLQAELDDFELRHFTIGRFVCVAREPPRTSKGNVARGRVAADHGDLLRALTDCFVARPGFVQLDRMHLLAAAATRFVHPLIGGVMQALRLDKQYEEARGDRLWYTERGVRHEVVDFVGGFGGTLLGHGHADVTRAAREALDDGKLPLADQGSARTHEGELARRLALEVGRDTGGAYVVRFGSTGAEAVEMALAHAFLERRERVRRFLRDQRRDFGGVAPERVRDVVARVRHALGRARPVVLAMEGSFHGHSLGARSVLGSRRGRAPFRALTRVQPVFLPASGDVDLEELIARHALAAPRLAWVNGEVVEEETSFSSIVAAIAEPVRGEGGIQVVSPDLLRRLEGRPFPLILDEIQCGLGRTGSFLASRGIHGSYYLFAKSLGGGIAKISAVLIERHRYVPAFDRRYASTFAGDAYSCAVASSVLDALAADNIAERAAERGRALAARLELARHRYPDVLQPVAGAGLMQAIRIRRGPAERSLLLRMAARHESLGVLASAYLLNRHGIRVLPTLSAPDTLRLEPSAFVDDVALERLGHGLEAFAGALQRGDTCELVSFLVEERPDAPAEDPTTPVLDCRIEPPAPGAVRVAFLNHFTAPARELSFAEPSLRRLPAHAREALFARVSAILDMKPTLAFARNLFDGRVWFASVLLPVNAADMEELHRSGRRERLVESIQQTLDRYAARGCAVGVLGAYTSIVTADGLSLLPPPGMRLTSGNALTAAVAARRVRRMHSARARGATIGIVGASGNIGSVIAHELALDGSGGRLVLLGRSSERLDGVRRDILEAGRANGDGLCARPADLCVATDLSALRDCDMVVVAAGTGQALVCPHHLSTTRPVLVADVSVPGALSPELRAMPNVSVHPVAGAVTVPGSPGFLMAPHIPSGTAYACAAEGMILALEPERTAALELVGRIRPPNARLLADLAEELGMLETASLVREAAT